MKKAIRAILPGSEPRVNRKKRFIPVSSPEFGRREMANVVRCIRTGWISSLGNFVREFEDGFSARCGARYGVCCSSGTAALHLAMASLGIGPGDEVIIPSFTMVSTAFAAVYQGAVPVFVDSEEETGNIDPAKIAAAVTRRTKAIVCVHIYGHPCDMDPILRIARKHGLAVIEDAAEAHGAEYKGKRVGAIGDIGCFSFYGNKVITTGEGGMLVTNRRRLKERAASLLDMAFSPERHFWHKELAFNYRMSNIQAAVGLAQTESLERFIEKKRLIARWYTNSLSGFRGLSLPVEKPYARNVYWMYGVRVDPDSGISRDRLRQSLADAGIESRVFFIPMHLQPVFSRSSGSRGSFPVAEELCRTGMYLPSGTGLNHEDIRYIAETVKDALR